MYEVMTYTARWSKRPGTTERVGKPVRKKVIGQFETLDEARQFSEGQPKSVIVFSKQAIKELTG